MWLFLDVAAEAKERGVTRAFVSMERAAALPKPCIFAIGNAPTALFSLEALMEAGKLHPALIIGVPVGFVNVVESKERIIKAENRYSFILPKNIPAEFHPGQTAEISVNADTVGIIGKLHPSICKEAVYVFEINLDKLLSKRVGNLKYKEISKFPNIKKDVAFVMNKDVQSKQIETTIKKAGGNLLTNIEVFDVYTGENVGENEKSIAYALTFNDSKKTLTDEEVNSIFEKIITTVESKCGVKLRK